MKLTKRGKDCIKALLAGIVPASIIDIKIVLAICLAIAIGAIISEVMLLRATAGGIEIVSSLSHATCFKGESCNAEVKVNYPNQRFVNLAISKISLDRGVRVVVQETEKNNVRKLKIEPEYAGRFQGITANLELRDPLGLFRKSVSVRREDFLMDCYPLALLKEIEPAHPIAISLGEREGTSRGVGMEFYALDRYTSAVDRKNIFWKKVASMPDERLLVKIRTTNIPKTLVISVIEIADRGDEGIFWTDAACEGIGLLGKMIMQIGGDVELLYDKDGNVTSSVATSETEFSDSLMEMSAGGTSNMERASQLIAKADICVTGFIELQNTLFASQLARKQALLIADIETELENVSDMAVIYEKDADLSPLVNRIVGV